MKRARRTALMKQSGPYEVSSRADYALEVRPTWPEYKIESDGFGGPGVLTRMALAAQVEDFLNGRERSPSEFVADMTKRAKRRKK